MTNLNLTSCTSTDDFWYPLKPNDLWEPFVYCMMTVLDENHLKSKYHHILLVEFYEWIARIAFRFFDLKNKLDELNNNRTEIFRHD